MNELITLGDGRGSSITADRETITAMQKQASEFQHIRLNAKLNLVKVTVGGGIHLLVKFPTRNEPCPCGSELKWKRCCGAIRDIPDLPESERDPGPPPGAL